MPLIHPCKRRGVPLWRYLAACMGADRSSQARVPVLSTTTWAAWQRTSFPPGTVSRRGVGVPRLGRNAGAALLPSPVPGNLWSCHGAAVSGVVEATISLPVRNGTTEREFTWELVTCRRSANAPRTLPDGNSCHLHYYSRQSQGGSLLPLAVAVQGHRVQVQEQIAHDRNRGDLARLASWPQALREVWVDAVLPNHGQRRHVQGLAHGGPTAPEWTAGRVGGHGPATTARAPPAKSGPCGPVDPMRAERPPAWLRSGSPPPAHCSTAWLVGGGQHCAATGISTAWPAVPSPDRAMSIDRELGLY